MNFGNNQSASADALQEQIRLYNYMVTSCFKMCVNEFDNKDLSNNQAKCGEKCCKKMLGILDKMQESALKSAEKKMSRFK